MLAGPYAAGSVIMPDWPPGWVQGNECPWLGRAVDNVSWETTYAKIAKDEG
jgi:hypothetical protein